MDFYQIKERNTKNGVIEIYPDFKVCRSKDLMVRGRSFYAIWDENKGLWSTDEYDVQCIVDAELNAYKEKRQTQTDGSIQIKYMSDFSSKAWADFRSYMQHISDNAHQLDEQLSFLNTEIKKKDYISKTLPYSLEEGSIDAYEEIIGTLYEEEERAKLEWAIGAIISGDAKTIQKFVVLYGEAGAGKSTILNIIQQLFVGYYTTFEAKALTGNNNTFSTEQFKTNPLVAIQHDGDLSKIEDNTKLNSIVSHEEMSMRELYKPSYMARTNAFLFMGTNKPVKITDAKSGIIRRLIDVRPSGKRIPIKRYQSLISQIDFELGAIANHCLEVYHTMGKQYYSNYRPLDMMMQTDVFFNFVESNYHTFKEQDGATLTQAYDMYKTYCDEALIDFKLPRHKFREELKNYFNTFEDITRIDGKQVRSYYQGFDKTKFKNSPYVKEEKADSLVFDCTESIFDEMGVDWASQYASEKEIPIKKWEEVTTKLSELDTSKLHYVRVPINHIVIDFDIKDKGKKSLEKNIEAASKWPATYSELSKSGSGVHLHYIYDGDAEKLSRIFDEGIEVKVFSGNASLRRRLTKCNNIPIRTIKSGLPVKGEKMINFDSVKSERGIRDLIKRNLNKEIHPGTKPSIDFIHKILEEAYKSGVSYDVTDLRPKILTFALNSSNQADYCIKLIEQMAFKSEEINQACDSYANEELVFFDVEVFPNLFVVVWKFKGKPKIKMINPKPEDIAGILKLKLVGFNCRRYDNHILYARYIGYDNYQLYQLSQKIINNSKNAMFGEAYNISYTDVYDFACAGNKMSLKKWEIKLGIHHQELGLPWDQDVPEEKWDLVADYCGNDVDATEATFDELAGDWAARQILAELSGLSVNDTTNQHSIKIVFGNDKDPQSKFNYPDLSKMFPGYKFENGKSSYRGMITGEGGYVESIPGMYSNVAVLDAESMHPTSIEAEDMFGPYTKNYSDLKAGRVAIKNKDFDKLRTLLDGRLIPFIENALSDNPRFTLKDVSNGLKTALNSAYGLTSAGFPNPFKDPRNKDNVVAKRGALFMIDLREAVNNQGFKVVHIKTDSIKIPDATPEIIQFVQNFGKEYGYTFVHEETYSKFCLVNDAVYIAKVGWTPDGKHVGEWTATGSQFAQPYVFKTLFSKEPIVFEDMCETKSVSTALYLDMNEGDEEQHEYNFIGKVGSFCPIRTQAGGGLLMREKEGKYYAASGSKGYRWLEAEMIKELGKEDDIDREYYLKLVDDAVDDISEFGDFEWFVADDSVETKVVPFSQVPWALPCGSEAYNNCTECPEFPDIEYVKQSSQMYKCKLGYEVLPF